jgi:hypothetical protein
MALPNYVGSVVLLRSGADNYVGTVSSQNGSTVTLTTAKKVWAWQDGKPTTHYPATYATVTVNNADSMALMHPTVQNGFLGQRGGHRN